MLVGFGALFEANNRRQAITGWENVYYEGIYGEHWYGESERMVPAKSHAETYLWRISIWRKGRI